MNNLIKSIDVGSIAEEMGIEPGDLLLEINGKPVVDIIDFLYFMDDASLELVIKKPDGEEWELEIEKDFDEALGINFENPILDHAKHCSNRCVFCFIDQLPKGMRESLYFKDDDSRLSFLMGNFVTLTNMNDATFQRILDYHISPINISIHTVDPDLRVQMLGNPQAGKILERLQALQHAGIGMNGQVVLCPNLNDGLVLDETIETLSKLYPQMTSMAVVPIGLTRFRDGLFKMEAISYDKANAVIDQVEKWQSRLLETMGSRFVFAADEFYLTANRPMPLAEAYEGYVQIENGVGLIRQFEDGCLEVLASTPPSHQHMHFDLATSVGARDMMVRIWDQVKVKRPHYEMTLHVIQNDYFGPLITVAGLLTATDLVTQLKDSLRGQVVLLPEILLNTDDLTLDDWTKDVLSETLEKPVVWMPNEGKAFMTRLLEEEHT